MGLRYRKSINLGGGFRVNISKSGVGYSWGTKGYRVTKKAGGGTRKTYSVPGTGLSWTDDSKKGRKQNTRSKSKSTTMQGKSSSNGNDMSNVLYQANDVDARELVSDNTKEFIEAIKHFTKRRNILMWCCSITFVLSFGMPPMAALFVAFLVGYIVYNSKGKIKIEYDCDEYGKRRIQMLDQAVNLLIDNKKIWQIVKDVATTSKKTHAGAGASVERKPVTIVKEKPFFIKTKATCYCVNLSKDKIYILPDRLIVKGKKGWGAVDFSELHIEIGSQGFIESEQVPKDATVTGYTWQYVNKNGSPDKRYSNNRQLPRCSYGVLKFSSPNGFDVMLYISNVNNASSFKTLVTNMIKEAEQMRISAEKEMKETVVEQSNIKESTVDADKPIENVKASSTENSGQDMASTVFSQDEDRILGQLKKCLEENNLPCDVGIKRGKDGELEVFYKSNLVGKFYLQDGIGWISFLMGTSGKTKTIEGTEKVVVENINKWVRYIINYL